MKPEIEYRPKRNLPPSVTPSGQVRRGKDAGSTPASGTTLFKDGDEIFKSVTLIKRDKAKHAARMRDWRAKKKRGGLCSAST